MRIFKSLIALLAAVVTTLVLIAGCGGGKEAENGEVEKGPEYVTAYEAAEYTRAKADKWQEENWVIQIKESDSSINEEGKARIWQVFYFSPTPEEQSQMFVTYNRGNVWANAPGKNKGGEEGREIYREEKPEPFRVDSPEAVTIADRNGGSEYLKGHPDAATHATLRCKADYDAIGEDMPAPKYKWIWDVYYREPVAGSEVLHILVDGMNGDFITKELEQPPAL